MSQEENHNPSLQIRNPKLAEKDGAPRTEGALQASSDNELEMEHDGVGSAEDEVVRSTLF